MFGWSYPAGCTSTPYDDDAPEECPCCGAANADEDGEPVFLADPSFCSSTCRDGYVNRMRAYGEAEGVALAAIEAAEARWATELAAIKADEMSNLEGNARPRDDTSP